jgi:hypothetical protein
MEKCIYIIRISHYVHIGDYGFFVVPSESNAYADDIVSGYLAGDVA